jgi:hypothetical protein
MAMYIHEIGRIDAEPHGAAETAPWLACGPSDRLHDVVGHERRQMGLQADRSHARSAAAVRDGEGLVQVHVADVGADVARRGEADLRVEVGAVHVNLAAVAWMIAQISLIASSNTPCVDG